MQGDKNVTENIMVELKKRDWNMLISHFLGLDHIGHVEGSFSSKVPNKLKEIDEVILNINTAMHNRGDNYFLFVTSDHGMRDKGGHGGNSYHESHVPLVAFGLDCKSTE